MNIRGCIRREGKKVLFFSMDDLYQLLRLYALDVLADRHRLLRLVLKRIRHAVTAIKGFGSMDSEKETRKP